DGLEAVLPQGECGVHAAIVEFDPLADAVRAASEDHDFLPRRRVRFALLLIGAVQVRREGFEFGGARVDALVGWLETLLHARRAHRVFIGAEHAPELPVAEPRA